MTGTLDGGTCRIRGQFHRGTSLKDSRPPHTQATPGSDDWQVKGWHVAPLHRPAVHRGVVLARDAVRHAAAPAVPPLARLIPAAACQRRPPWPMIGLHDGAASSLEGWLDRQGSRSHDPVFAAAPRRPGDQVVNRRAFVAALTTLVPVPRAAQAQQRAMPAIGYLSTRSPGDSAHIVGAYRKGLNEAGYIEGQNVTIEFRFAEGHHDRL